MPPKRKKKAKTPKKQSQSQRQSVTVNINTTKAKRSKSRSRSALPASYPPQFAPTFVTSNQDFDRVTPLLAGILQSQQQMFRDISVPTQPMIKAEEPTPTSNFQKPNSLEGFGAPPPLQSSASAKSTGSVQSSVMGSPKDFDNVENDFVSTSLPQKKAPLARSKLDEPLPDLKPIPEPVQPSKKSMIPGKSFFSKTYNPNHGETLRGKELENKSRKDIKTEPAFVPEGRKPLNLLPRVVEKKAEPVPEVRKPLNLLPRFGGKKAEPVPEVRKPLNLQPRIGAKKVEQSDNPPSKQSVLAQRLNPRKSIDDEDRPALEILKTEPPDYRSQSLRRATKEGEETIELLQKIMGSQSRPQETDAPPNIRPLIPPTRERSLSNMLNIAETPPPNIPEPIRERSPSPEPIPKKVPEDRLSISEKKMIKRQKAEEEAKERAVMEIPEDIFPKKMRKQKKGHGRRLQKGHGRRFQKGHGRRFQNGRMY